ncbi:hypothetical protein ACFLT2_13775 [Acidobacteriota bacterium]
MTESEKRIQTTHAHEVTEIYDKKEQCAAFMTGASARNYVGGNSRRLHC